MNQQEKAALPGGPNRKATTAESHGGNTPSTRNGNYRKPDAQRDRDTEIPRNGVRREAHEAHDADEDLPPASRISTIPEAVEASLGPHAPKGDRLFVFCRALRAFEATHGKVLQGTDLESALAEWYRTAKRKGTLPDETPFDECRLLFKATYPETKHALGTSALEEAIRRGGAEAEPAEASHFEDRRIRRLVAVCYHLQALAGDAPFFLSARDAAEVLGDRNQWTKAARFLKGLCSMGILKVEAQGGYGGHRATRYRYRSKEDGMRTT